MANLSHLVSHDAPITVLCHDIYGGACLKKEVNRFSHDNKHIVYLASSAANKTQIEHAVHSAIQNLSISLKRPIVTDYRVNVVVDYNNEPYGYSYIWFTNPEVFYAFTGKNLDGSDRVKYIDDPRWTKTTKRKMTLKEVMIRAKTESWGLLQEEVDVQNDEIPKIKDPNYKAEPLVKLEDVQFDSHQQKVAHRLMVAEAEREGKDKRIIQMPKMSGFKVSAAYREDVKPGECRYILSSRKNPTWITPKDVRDAFVMYATDSTTIIQRTMDGKRLMGAYPFITIKPAKDGQVIKVMFDADTSDGQYARMMTRKVTITSGTQTKVCTFNYDQERTDGRPY